MFSKKRLTEKKTLDALNEKETELKEKIEQDQAIIDDPDVSPSNKEDARERMEENEQELALLQREIKERENALPLRERIKR